MGRIVVTEFVSLDGVMEDPGGSENFKYGGWSFEISRGEEGDKFKLDEAFGADALLLGRVTYQGFADAWPSRSGEFADKSHLDASDSLHGHAAAGKGRLVSATPMPAPNETRGGGVEDCAAAEVGRAKRRPIRARLPWFRMLIPRDASRPLRAA